jgi:uncharacterized membrane protein HdeD (DUF308 family)
LDGRNDIDILQSDYDRIGSGSSQDEGIMFDGKEKWWVKLILGLLGVVFGVMFILLPGVPWLIIGVLVGVFLVLIGFTFLFGGLIGGGTSGGDRMLAVIVGILAIIIGMVALVYPGLTDLFIVILLGFWLIFLGIMEIAGGNMMPKEVADKIMPKSRGLIIVSGVLDLLIGIIFVLMPVAGGVVIAWLAGLLLVILGMIYIYLAITNKNIDVPKVDVPKM